MSKRKISYRIGIAKAIVSQLSLRVQKGRLAKSSAEQVEKMVRIIREFGNEPATPDEARQTLGLKGMDKVNF